MEIIGEFNVFLGQACRRIPIKKLKRRICSELREHMEDMLDGFLESGEEKDAAIQKVIKEMGDPVKINKELRRAHRRKITFVRIVRALALFLFFWFLFVILPMLASTASHYCSGSTKEDLEAAMLQEEYNYKYCGEIERNGRVYLLYSGETAEKNYVHYSESIRLLGKFDIHNRFFGSGDGYGDGNILITLGYPDKNAKSETKVYFGFKPTKVKYFKFGFKKMYYYENDDMPDEIVSDFFAVPSPGEFTVIDTPEGYRFSGYYYIYDENKQIIEDCDPDDFSMGQSSLSRVSDSYGNS